MSIANWIGIILPVLGFLGAVALYALQRKIDRRETLRSEKKKAYTAFLDALFEHAEHRSEATRKAYDKSKIDLLLVAPDAVMKKLVAVQESAQMDLSETGPLDVDDAAISLIVEMRRDCFDRSTLNEQELYYVAPIGRRTPLKGNLEGHFEG